MLIPAHLPVPSTPAQIHSACGICHCRSYRVLQLQIGMVKGDEKIHGNVECECAYVFLDMEGGILDENIFLNILKI